jgi:predicted RND superfamily exporter protein
MISKEIVQFKRGAPSPSSGHLEPIFARVLRARWLFVALYTVLLVASVRFAMQVGQDNSLDRLIVQGDPDYIATQEFEKVFGSGEFAMLLAEADDPFAPPVLARVDAIERAGAKIPRVTRASSSRTRSPRPIAP